MVGYGDRAEFQNEWGIVITATKFAQRDTKFYYIINQYVYGDPETTTTDAQELAMLRGVSHDLQLQAVNYHKAMSMEDPPPFLQYMRPQILPDLKAILDPLKTINIGVGH